MTGKTSPLITITLGIILAGSSVGLCVTPATLRDLAERALLTPEPRVISAGPKPGSDWPVRS